ncbi:hypothetical protein [Acidovorax sp. 106]|uniref:hypothetical protein n=1 Tax=Acidovorax sp. 106 TaxID=2135637 RepID=UPI000EAFD07C|nr:hypothetical protein [Acidovorax sp. 106]
MPSTLRLWFEFDSDGTGELFAEVTSGKFSGTGSAWFDAQALLEFGETLASAYPLPSDTPLSLEGGYWAKSGAVIEQLHLGLRFYPIGSIGKVGCRVTLATPVHEGQDRPEAQSMVAVELNTNYEQLRTFAHSIEALAKGAIVEAVLQTEG